MAVTHSNKISRGRRHMGSSPEETRHELPESSLLGSPKALVISHSTKLWEHMRCPTGRSQGQHPRFLWGWSCGCSARHTLKHRRRAGVLHGPHSGCQRPGHRATLIGQDGECSHRSGSQVAADGQPCSCVPCGVFLGTGLIQKGTCVVTSDSGNRLAVYVACSPLFLLPLIGSLEPKRNLVLLTPLGQEVENFFLYS